MTNEPTAILRARLKGAEAALVSAKRGKGDAKIIAQAEAEIVTLKKLIAVRVADAQRS